MTRKKLTIGISIAVAVVVIIAVGAIVTLNVIDSRAEAQVRAQMDDALAESGMTDVLTYESVSVDSLRGRVAVEGIVFEEDGVTLNIDSATLQLPRSEALALAQNPEDATLTDISFRASAVKLSDEANEVSFTMDELGADFKGSVPIALFSEEQAESVNPADLMVNSSAFTAAGASLSLPQENGSLSLADYSLEVSGEVSAADFANAEDTQSAMAALLRNPISFSFELAELAMNLNETARTDLLIQLRMVFGPVPLLENPDNWRINSMSLVGETSDTGVQVSSLSGASNFLEFEASGALGLSDDLRPAPPLDVNLEVSRYDEELRPLFEVLAQQIARSSLPQGDSFSLNIAMADRQGVPDISLE